MHWKRRQFTNSGPFSEIQKFQNLVFQISLKYKILKYVFQNVVFQDDLRFVFQILYLNLWNTPFEIHISDYVFQFMKYNIWNTSQIVYLAIHFDNKPDLDPRASTSGKCRSGGVRPTGTTARKRYRYHRISDKDWIMVVMVVPTSNNSCNTLEADRKILHLIWAWPREVSESLLVNSHPKEVRTKSTL